jgi:hypothetical protein
MAGRNVHKADFRKVKLPFQATQEDRGLKLCAEPLLVLASISDSTRYKNDLTGISLKVDSMDIFLEKGTEVIAAPGEAVSFPYQSDAVGFVIDWRQVIHVVNLETRLNAGCWRVRVDYELAGIEGSFYWGSFNLLPYSIDNSRDTTRILSVYNSKSKNDGINYRNSGFITSIRFRGFFGYMQPNLKSENIINSDDTRRVIRNDAVPTYELLSGPLMECFTKRIVFEMLLRGNTIWISDHSPENHSYNYLDFPVILNDEDTVSMEYMEGSRYAKVLATFHDKTWITENIYSGQEGENPNISFNLPNGVVAEGCLKGVVNVNQSNGTLIASIDVASGGVEPYNVDDSVITVDGSAFTSLPATNGLNVQVVDQNNNTVPTLLNTPQIKIVQASSAPVMKTGQTTSFADFDDGFYEAGRDVGFFTLERVPFNIDGTPTINTTTNRFTDTLGGQVYANNIMLDWSTHNVFTGNLLAYSLEAIGSKNFLTHLTDSTAYSLGGLATWRQINRKEIQNLYNDEIVNPLNWSPFNLNANFSANISTNTTRKIDTTQVWYTLSGQGREFGIAKTTAIQSIYVRTINTSEL